MSVLENWLPTRTQTRDALDEPPYDVARVLGNKRRYRVIRALTEQLEYRFDDLVHHVARHEYGDDYTTQERKRIHVALYQNHLDDLADDDIITLREDGRRIQRGPQFDGYRQAADALEEVTA